ncbi:hypothetical protein [Streptomyces cylindrosporus]|uniref:Uncharacterized protein n=1 Tax=Streptomyces cylindrosporus TaxID=2927583 RepID=A0ABS9YFQ0_9ACTN|nr:hypothetical protein [Streptomyces cylindrosporus]MCI3276057.1 hypothetical protein [Streptomyces cylindrosporus]
MPLLSFRPYAVRAAYGRFWFDHGCAGGVSVTGGKVQSPENYVDSEHLASLIESGQALVVPVDVCRAFHDVLLEFPWLPTRIDWNAVEHVAIDLDEIEDSEIAVVARELGAPLHTHLLVLFTPAQPGLLCETEKALGNLDHFFWKAPGARYFCGVDVDDNGRRYRYRDFGEFDGNAKVTLRVRRAF